MRHECLCHAWRGGGSLFWWWSFQLVLGPGDSMVIQHPLPRMWPHWLGLHQGLTTSQKLRSQGCGANGHGIMYSKSPWSPLRTIRDWLRASMAESSTLGKVHTVNSCLGCACRWRRPRQQNVQYVPGNGKNPQPGPANCKRCEVYFLGCPSLKGQFTGNACKIGPPT